MKKCLITYAVPREGLRALETRFELIYPENKEGFSKAEILNLLPDIEIVLTIFTQPFDAEFMRAAPKLKMIANYGVGFNNIDINEASKRGIIVTNTPNAVTEPTAEMALALMLSLVRNVCKTDREIRQHTIEWGLMKNLGTTLRNKTLGIIGMGRIGQSTALKAKAFGMNIVYFSRNAISSEKEALISAKKLELNELIALSDVISIHLPLTEQTHHFINKESFALMKPSAVLVNTARGPIIDELELINRLKTNQIAGAALDVFEFEPEISDELLLFDNVVLTPHIGTGTFETRIETSEEAALNILAYLEGKNPPNRVN